MMLLSDCNINTRPGSEPFPQWSAVNIHRPLSVSELLSDSALLSHAVFFHLIIDSPVTVVCVVSSSLDFPPMFVAEK